MAEEITTPGADVVAHRAPAEVPPPPGPIQATRQVTSQVARVNGQGSPRWIAALAGVASAAVALATTELLTAGEGSNPSLVTSVGTWIIDSFAGPLREPAIALFGTNDKSALLAGTVLVALALGAAVGLLARRHFALAASGLLCFGLAGVLTGLRDPLQSAAIVAVAAASGVAAGTVSLFALLHIATASGTPATSEVTATATRRDRAEVIAPGGRIETGRAGAGGSGAPARPAVTEHPTDPKATRRSFFAWTGAAGAFAAGATIAGHSLRGRSRVEEVRAGITLPKARPGGSTPLAATGEHPAGGAGSIGTGKAFEVEGLTPYVTANDSFYRIDTALLSPQVDTAGWSLRVSGLVDHAFDLTYGELMSLPMVEEAVTLSCVSNTVGGDLVSNAVWQGVPLRSLLDRAGIGSSAAQVAGMSVDGWAAGFPIEAAYDGRTALVAVGMNGEPLPVDHGFPARLVVAGLYGYVSATKWLREIRLTTWDGFDGYWIGKGWSKKGPVKTQSRIDVPSGRVPLAAGRQPIAGVAWAPHRGIRKVEVRVDGTDWVEAHLAEALSDNTWRQWMVEWEATPGPHQIEVRATDGTGETQIEAYSAVEPDGATGWHHRRVTVGA